MMREQIPRDAALDVCRELLPHLEPACEEGRLKVVGSLRRRKSENCGPPIGAVNRRPAFDGRPPKVE